MKFSAALLLPVVVSAAVLEPRQASTYRATTKELTPRWRQNSKRTFTRVGPFKLLAGQSGRHGMSLDSNGQGINFNIPAGTFCNGGDCTFISGQTGLQFEDGSVADVSKGVYIHHILATNTKKRVEPFVSQCDAGDPASIRRPSMATAGFVGGSDDNLNEPMVYGTKDGSIEGGYWFSKGDSVGVWADLVNYDKKEKTLYVTYDMEWLPGHVGSDAQGSLITVTGCGARRIATPSDRAANTTSGKFRFFRNGYLVNGKGHLHDGGVAMDLMVNGKTVCSSNAVYGGETGTTVVNGKKWETIAGMTMCPGPIKIKDGDYMQLNARYDLKSHPLRENPAHKMAEVMGMWTMPFISEKGSAAPGRSAVVEEVGDEQYDFSAVPMNIMGSA